MLCEGSFLRSAASAITFLSEYDPTCKRWSNEFPGDYTDGETPDPIPNSEAKPVRPMIVLWAKVGDCQEL